jgi:hypothetical protein
MLHRRNAIDLFTRAELEAGLSLLYGPEAGARVAAEVYAIPAEEAIHYDWIEPALWLMACVSDELDARVRAIGGDGDGASAFQERIAEFKAWLPTVPRDVTPGLSIRDVIHDSRLDEDSRPVAP